ncbi:MAG TPA: hypothetical protein VGA69_08340, partial [Nitriliruptorales bacterium]
MTSLTVSRQVAVGFVVSLVATLLLVVVATVSLDQVSSAKDLVIERDLRLVVDAHRLEANLADGAMHVRGYLLTGASTEQAEVEASRGLFDLIVADLEDGVHSDLGRRLLDRIVAAGAVYRDASDEGMALRRTGAGSDAIETAAATRLFP